MPTWNNPQFKPVHPSQLAGAITTAEDPRSRQTRIRIQIPKHYSQEPVISRLVSDHGLSVNVKAALLGADTQSEGWFDLELQGTSPQIQSALVYLAELDIKIWSKSTDPDEENW